MSRARAALALVLRLGLATLLAYAAIAKLRDPTTFAREIANYQLLPRFAPHFAVVVPAAELVAAIGLLLPSVSYRRASALLASGLFGAFLVAVTSVVVRGVNVECGCFGSGSGAIGPLTVVRNVALTLGALYLVFAERETPAPAGAAGRSSSEAGGETRPG